MTGVWYQAEKTDREFLQTQMNNARGTALLRGLKDVKDIKILVLQVHLYIAIVATPMWYS